MEREQIQKQQEQQTAFVPKIPSKNPLGGLLAPKPSPPLALPKISDDSPSSPKKPAKTEQPLAIKKTGGLIGEDDEEEDSFPKKPKQPIAQNKKPKKILFGDSDEEVEKPKETVTSTTLGEKSAVKKPAKSKNTLFNDDEDDSDVFKKKSVKK